MAAMVRIRSEDHEVLKALSQQTGESMSDLLSRAIEQYRRRHFLYGLASDFAALRVREGDWDDELEERAAWDQALGDDLEGD